MAEGKRAGRGLLWLSIAVKLAAAGAALWGSSMAIFAPAGTFMGDGRAFLYFTIQSNLILAAVEAAMAAFLGVTGGKRPVPPALGILHFWSVVSITLTFMVFCLMLAPFIPGAWVLSNVLTHVTAPVAAIVDYLFLDRAYRPTKKQVVLTTVMPMSYLCLTVVTYLCRVEFSPGVYYPYNFVNYGGSAGVFGFSTDLSDSLYLGSFYWVVILTLFVIGVAAVYRLLHNWMCRGGT